jgi:hypothetical protein
MKNRATVMGGGSAASADKERSKPFNNPPARAAQHPPEPHVRRAIAPPLPYGTDTVAAILEAVALHLRRTVPTLSSLTLNDFDEALADLHPQLRERHSMRN